MAVIKVSGIDNAAEDGITEQYGIVKSEFVYVCMARSQAEEALLFLPCICFDFADNCRYDTMDFFRSPEGNVTKNSCLKMIQDIQKLWISQIHIQ